MSKQSILAVSFVVILAACGGSRPVISGDAGTSDTGSIALVDSGGPRDTGTTARDTGGGPADPCATDATGSAAGVGCNGGFQTAAPAANAPGGACTGDAAGGQGTCTGAGVCSGAEGAAGFCFPSCTAGATYVSTSTCPTGFRCFDLDMDLCFRDCDATHPCPTGMDCDDEGSCVPM